MKATFHTAILSLLLALYSASIFAAEDECQRDQDACKTSCSYLAMDDKVNHLNQQFECMYRCTQRIPCRNNTNENSAPSGNEQNPEQDPEQGA